ncbi:hypothetical protein GS584_25130 [Rhodococcus hoagii]|nr:hypothetical protein [Prescottella equi]
MAADLIWKTHSENADLFTPADRYGPDAHGVFQMVFCDRGTPKPGVVGDNNLYSRLREALVERGMARDEVAFIHDYPSPKQKQELFADCRAGKVRVLIGSTPKLGTGVNAQRLLKQLISLDPAWTAADMQQRFGRIIRQGNVHAEVDVVNVVARRSYDATMWQIIERKANAVQQIRSADVPDTMEDVGGDIALSAAQTKAAATGDPVYVQVVEQQAFVDGLESEQTMIANGNASRHAAIERLDRNVQRLDAAQAGTRRPCREGGRVARDRGPRPPHHHRRWQTIADNDSESLVAAFQHVLQTKYIDARTIKSDKPIDMFEVGGITVTGRYSRISDVLQLSVTPGGHRYIDTPRPSKRCRVPPPPAASSNRSATSSKTCPRRQPTPTASSNAPSPAATNSPPSRTPRSPAPRNSPAPATPSPNSRPRSTPARTPPEHSRTEATTSTAAAPKASTRSGPWT